MISLASIIESLLFIHGEPISAKRLVQITEKSREEVEQALNELEKNERGRGVILLKRGEEYQLGTHPEHAPYIERMIQHEFSESLSKQALETLAVIAYQGPLSKTDIDYTRGINSAFILRTLLVRGLIERAEGADDARSHVYQISFDFLKHFGLQSPEELPRYHEFKTQNKS